MDPPPRCCSLLLLLLTAVISAASGGSSEFGADNPIRPVTDRPDPSSLEATLLHALAGARNAVSFARFARRYGKTYRSAEEIKQRFGIFVENLRVIRSSNRRRRPYTLGVNRFADMTWEEFRAHHLGAAQNCSATLRGSHRVTDQELPEMMDWREVGIVSPVKNQGRCGSCWTFRVDCASAYNNFGCNGGLPSQAFEYIKYNGGLDTEDSYPYAATNGVCKFTKENVGVKVIDSVNITLGAEDELKHAVGTIRPVSVAFEVVHDFRFYKGGVYTSNNCGSTPTDVNHAVLAVGYGVENGVPYWLIKNSWGKDWGVDGYFKMELGKNMCGVATCASYPIVAV